MSQSPLVTAFAAAAPPTVRDRIDGEWARVLDERFAAARAAWPALDVTPERFGAYLARLAPAELTLETLAELHLDSLVLTCACAHGDVAALQRCEERYFPILTAALARMRLGTGQIEEITQQMRDELFVRSPTQLPRIADYAGRGNLASWLTVSATRAAYKHLRREKRNVSDEDAQLADEQALQGDAEVEMVKRRLRPLFRESFAHALGALERRDRSLLRQHYLDELTLEEIAVLYRTHRATAARWLASARQALLDGTRQALMSRLRMPKAECESIIRMARSELDMTMRSLFASTVLTSS